MKISSEAQPDKKVALITGAALRIGRQIALSMAQNGWDIVLHYGKSEAAARLLTQEISALGRHAIALQCDLSDPAQVTQLVPRAMAAMGRIDCLVNNASLFIQDSASDFSSATLAQHMQVNLTAPVLLTQALHAQTAEGQQACVINLLDQKLYNLNPDFLSYTLSKAALQTATTMLAQALAPRLRVVGIAPGISLVSGDQSEEDFRIAHQKTPLGRSSTPLDIANTVCFVAGCPALTGSTILVDGGQHLIPSQRDVMFLASASAVSTDSEASA